MGNLCSSGSERVDSKEEKRVPEKLKDGEDEALLPKFSAGVGLVTGEGSVDGGGSSGRVGSADVTPKVLENGQCVMAGGRSVCPEIVVSGSDVEPVEDEDDDDFLNSVIAVAADTTGRAVSTARDVVAEIEARNLPQSEDAVFSFPEASQVSTRDSVSVDYSDLVKSSRGSVGAESGNWADSVLMSATTAAQSAFNGSNFGASDFSSDFTRKEASVYTSDLEDNSNNIVGLSSTVGDSVDEEAVPGNFVERSHVSGENSNNIVGLSSTVGDSVDEEAVPGNSVERSQVSGENSQLRTDRASGIFTSAEHTVENALSNSDGLSKDAGLSGPQLNGRDRFGSSVDGLTAEVEGCERWVINEASDHQDSLDLASAGRTKLVSAGDQTGAREDGVGTSVDAQVDLRDTSQQEYDPNYRDEGNTQGKQFICADVPCTLEAAVGQRSSQVSSQLEKTAGSCAETAGKGTGSALVNDGIAVDSNSTGNFKGNNILPSTFSSQENEIPAADTSTSAQQRDGEMQLTAKTEAASTTQRELSDAVVADEKSVVVVNENQEAKLGEDPSDTSFFPPTVSPHTREAELSILDRGTLPPEDDVFADWSIVSDTDFLKYVKSDDDLNHEAAARDIVESIIARASLIISGTKMEQGVEDSFLSFVDTEEATLADQRRDAMLASLADRFSSPSCPRPKLSSTPPLETDQCQPALVESATSSISQGDLTETEELLIPPVSSLDVLGESRNSPIFGSSDEDNVGDDASIKQTAWGITDKAVQEAIKIVAENGCHFDEDFNQPHNNDLDLHPSEDASVHDECNSVLSMTSQNNSTDSPTHMNGVNSLPAYSTPDHQSSAQPEITPAEETLAQSISHTNKPLENDLMDIPDNPTHTSPLISSDSEFISSSSLPTSNGQHGDSDSNTVTSPLYFSKVPSSLPALDNDFLPDKPLIIINSPDSAANTGSNEDISVHTEALI